MKLTDSHAISADFPFQPHYVEVLGSRLHYIDEGAGDPILFLHGQPTSSYIWRNIIPHLASLGRCLALDLIGFGKSDKSHIDYRFFEHLQYVAGFIDQLSLRNLTLVIHDWGATLGMYHAMRHEANIKAIAFLEMLLQPLPAWEQLPPMAKGFLDLVKGPASRQFIIEQNGFIEQILPGWVVRKLSAAEMDHYREPFLDPASREPVWRWPQEVPVGGQPADVHQAVAANIEWLARSALPKLLFYGRPGFVIDDPAVAWCRQNLSNLTAVDIGPGVHCLQEDNPDLIGTELARWYAALRP